MEKKIVQRWLQIVIIGCVLMGAVSLEMVSYKVVKTASCLIILNDNARFYDEQSIKTDIMTDVYEGNDTERQKFYNSDDFVVRFYSNSWLPVKILLLVVFGLLLITIPLAVICAFAWTLQRKKDYKEAVLERIKAVECILSIARNPLE